MVSNGTTTLKIIQITIDWFIIEWYLSVVFVNGILNGTRVSEWYLTEWYSEWCNGILNGTYKKLFSFFVNGIWTVFFCKGYGIAWVIK